MDVRAQIYELGRIIITLFPLLSVAQHVMLHRKYSGKSNLFLNVSVLTFQQNVLFFHMLNLGIDDLHEIGNIA